MVSIVAHPHYWLKGFDNRKEPRFQSRHGLDEVHSTCANMGSGKYLRHSFGTVHKEIGGHVIFLQRCARKMCFHFKRGNGNWEISFSNKFDERFTGEILLNCTKQTNIKNLVTYNQTLAPNNPTISILNNSSRKSVSENLFVLQFLHLKLFSFRFPVWFRFRLW